MRVWISLFSKIWEEILSCFLLIQARTCAGSFPFYTHHPIWPPEVPLSDSWSLQFAGAFEVNEAKWKYLDELRKSWNTDACEILERWYAVSCWWVPSPESHGILPYLLSTRQSYSHTVLSCDCIAHIFICFLPNLLIIFNNMPSSYWIMLFHLQNGFSGCLLTRNPAFYKSCLHFHNCNFFYEMSFKILILR